MQEMKRKKGSKKSESNFRERAEELLRKAHDELETRVRERIMESAKANEALLESEERYRNLFENIPIGIYRTTPDGRILMANPALIRMLGYTSFSELASHNLEEEGFQPTYDRSRFKELMEKQGEVKGLESKWMKPDGSIISIRENAKAVRGEDGAVLYYEGTVEDITERKLAEERFRLVVESVPNAVVMTNQRGEIVFVNSQTERLFGYSREELIGRSIEILVPERSRKKHSEYRTGFNRAPEARPMGVGRDLFALRKDGTEIPVEIGLTPIQTDEGPGVLSSIVDITQRKRMEEALRESEERLRAIMDNTTDAIFVYDENGIIISTNREAQRLLGKNKIRSIWDIIPLEDRARFSERLKDVKEGNRLLDYETHKVLENGERIPVSVGLVYVADGGGRFIETVRDIKERVILRNKIIEVEKAQVVGKMAEGIAHHMGTPLASMLLRVQMLREDMPKTPEYEKIVEKLDSIERQIFYSQRIIQRLLKFVSKPESEKSPERVSTLIEDSVEIINPLLKKRGIEMKLSMDEDSTVLADSNLLGLVFVDIMMNAVDAMPEGGRLSITASRGNPKNLVDIVISDTGTGIPKELLPLVFEPFFSTKPSGKGTGLGLSVAKRIIHDHGGEISIESIEGRGTSVLIRLPLYTEEKGIAQA